jgi:hypothetical protein
MVSGERFSDAALTMQLAVSNLLNSTIEIFPAFVVPFLWTFFGSLLVQEGERTRSFRLEVFFFSCAGAVGAYINNLSRGSLLDNLIPSLVVGIAFLAQLLGLSKATGAVPMASPKVLVAAAGVALSFAVASRYFVLLFGAKEVVNG